MDSNGKFWVSVWAVAGIALLGFVLLINTYYINKGKNMIAMLELGHSPMEISCMLDDELGDNPTCVIIVSNKE